MENRTKLQAVRRELGYPAATVLRLLAERARAHNVAIMTPASLKTKLSRWENGHEAVGLPEYRRLFREIYGRTDVEHQPHAARIDHFQNGRAAFDRFPFHNVALRHDAVERRG